MVNPTLKSKFSLLAPAKVNLGLRITGKRPDGYHDLQSLMVPLSVGDTLDFEVLEAAGAWSANCDHPEVPTGEGSLIEKAFRYAARALGYRGGLKVDLKKAIPMGAGLGGGSSDAAAVMRAVEKITGKAIPPERYPEVATQIGADVPFFLKDGAKWVLGIGEEVRRINQLPDLHVVLVHPGVGISTQWVYSQLKIESLTSQSSVDNLPAVFESMACLRTFLGASLTNDLESVVLPHYPVVGEMKKDLETLGADAALMSGSGSTVFGLFSDPNKMNQAAAALKAKRPHWWVCACTSVG
jgi:4-diphosphocytidyl-2-C-methyl-D-erythritol kinase